ncbi:putative cytokinetic ring protein SteA [Halalkalibacter urbisdiaboli]|uniref:putative cytokinetic ring protein SteA n=1 Tax=Halalkalibacter urbisdiaboli TaxID=1960589 RepID=UPI000B446815|nr:putative cytokinetic ring protein SteA [Halalkalibacter urbisdiaboli]
MSSILTGNVYEHRRTKELLRYIPSEAIALIWHEDLDGMAVEGLMKKRVKAVINGKPSMSGRYKHTNVSTLLNAGIPVFDVITTFQQWECFNGEEILIKDNTLHVRKEGDFAEIASVHLYTPSTIEALLKKASQAYPDQLTSFVENTVDYAKRECTYFLTEPKLPQSLKSLNGYDVLIVARSPYYEHDLRAVRNMLKKKKVKIIAIDGAADGILRMNLTPDFILGDMDSISIEGLQCGATILCHENMQGLSPGKERLLQYGIEAETITFVGTSEDVAIHAAHWSGASHLYLIGCRISLHEFLEKGRAGMGASLLNRIQAGDRITDLKGIHRLVHPNDLKKQWLSNIFLQLEKLRFKLRNQFLNLGRFNVWRKKEAIRHE